MKKHPEVPALLFLAIAWGILSRAGFSGPAEHFRSMRAVMRDDVRQEVRLAVKELKSAFCNLQ